MKSPNSGFDCLVVGGGPAGLTAALYLARFRRSVRVMDASAGRALLIPTSHNYPGFPDGISGVDLIGRLRAQSRKYGADLKAGHVDAVARDGDGMFRVDCGSETMVARNILFATGVVDVEPELPDVKDAIRTGLVRHCPICDGYEVIDQKVAVIGGGSHGVKEARFLRHYTQALTLFTLGGREHIGQEDRAALHRDGIKIVDETLIKVDAKAGAIVGLTTAGGETYRFDTIYSALGCTARSQLPRMLGAACDGRGQVIVDEHLRTSVPNVYAAGDVANDLNQIAVAAGHAAIAATAIHNSLRDMLL